VKKFFEVFSSQVEKVTRAPLDPADRDEWCKERFDGDCPVQCQAREGQLAAAGYLKENGTGDYPDAEELLK